MARALKRITYAEDEADIRAVAVIALEKIGGYVVDACPSGIDALERASDFHPDFILLDAMMPGMNGAETLRRLKMLPELDGVPSAFMTVKAQPADIGHYFALGANGVIFKPFDPITLPQRLHTIWRHYHQP